MTGTTDSAISIGERSRRLLSEIQDRALSSSPSTIVLVEGLSDWSALETLATRAGRDLPAESVAIVPMGGASNLGRFLELVDRHDRDVRLAGLCDEAEQNHFRRLEPGGLFVCVRDLEDELIRALGVDAVEAIVDRAGDLPSLQKLQQMPFHRDRTPEQQLHRFIGTRSGRKHRYAQILAEALEVDQVPDPLRALLEYV